MKKTRLLAAVLLTVGALAVPATAQATEPTGPHPICGGDYYAPYPDDVTKFYQCDDFGKVFLLQCPPYSAFAADLNTCVPDFVREESR
ncbi:chitin binding peritrophin-A domain-containing protein [Streptomyces sp. NPDC094049]|uniref:chitin binding peritrophin-A domain-containing protein n=1 Tax=Streptomyces sp. NPDC094049 TaxID=3154987 RepID=UPI00332A506A